MSMTVTPDKLSEGLELLEGVNVWEAVQKDQLLKFAKQIDGSADKILQVIDTVDPTQTGPVGTGSGKYAQWILGQWIAYEGAQRSAKWNMDQYIKTIGELSSEVGTATVEGKALEFLKASDADFDRANQHASFEDADQRNRVKNILNRHDRLNIQRRAPEFSIFPDVFSYKTISELETAIKTVPADAFLTKGETERGELDPKTIPGSRPVFQGGGSVIFEINTVQAAMFHGAGTEMCFRETGYATKYIRRGPLYMAYSSNPEVLEAFQGSPDAQSLEGYKKIFAFTWDSMFGQHIGDPKYATHLWEIRTTPSNDWLFSPQVNSIPGLIGILEGLTHKRNRGFDKWVKVGSGDTFISGGDPSEVAPDTARPAERFTISDFEKEEAELPLFRKREDDEEDDEDEDEDDESGYSAEALEFVARNSLRIDSDGDVAIGSFGDDPRGQANHEYLEANYPGALSGNYAVASYDDESFWDELQAHWEGESLDDSRESDIRVEAEGEDWRSSEEEDFKTKLKDAILDIGNDETPDAEDEEDILTLGIPYPEWEEAIDKYTGWHTFLNELDIYYEWMDDYPTIDFSGYIDTFDREAASIVRKELGMVSPAEQRLKREVAGGQQFFPYAPPEDIEFESVLNRMRTPSRTETQRKDSADMMNILYGIPKQ